MSIVLLNSEKELKSFPITQSIKLQSTTDIEESDLNSTVYLFEVTRKDSLVNLSNPFTYNLSLIKRDYGKVDINFIKSDGPTIGTYNIEIVPKKPLDLLSTYLLYLDNKLSTNFLEISKSVSKSLSTISITTLDTLTTDFDILEITILETTRLLKNQSLLKLGFRKTTEPTHTEFILDLKKKRNITYSNINIEFISDIYIKGETFLISVSDRDTPLDESYSYIINTAGHSDIVPMELEEASTRLSNQAILDFYNTPITPVVPLAYTIKYLNINTMSINLPDSITKADIDIVNIVTTNKYPFNNYLLNNLKLYDSTSKYILKVLWDDVENSIILDLYYTPEELQDAQTDFIVLDTTDW